MLLSLPKDAFDNLLWCLDRPALQNIISTCRPLWPGELPPWSPSYLHTFVSSQQSSFPCVQHLLLHGAIASGDCILEAIRRGPENKETSERWFSRWQDISRARLQHAIEEDVFDGCSHRSLSYSHRSYNQKYRENLQDAIRIALVLRVGDPVKMALEALKEQEKEAINDLAGSWGEGMSRSEAEEIVESGPLYSAVTTECCNASKQNRPPRAEWLRSWFAAGADADDGESFQALAKSIVNPSSLFESFKVLLSHGVVVRLYGGVQETCCETVLTALRRPFKRKYERLMWQALWRRVAEQSFFQLLQSTTHSDELMDAAVAVVAVGSSNRSAKMAARFLKKLDADAADESDDDDDGNGRCTALCEAVLSECRGAAKGTKPEAAWIRAWCRAGASCNASSGHACDVGHFGCLEPLVIGLRQGLVAAEDLVKTVGILAEHMARGRGEFILAALRMGPSDPGLRHLWEKSWKSVATVQLTWAVTHASSHPVLCSGHMRGLAKDHPFHPQTSLDVQCCALVAVMAFNIDSSGFGEAHNVRSFRKLVVDDCTAEDAEAMLDPTAITAKVQKWLGNPKDVERNSSRNDYVAEYLPRRKDLLSAFASSRLSVSELVEPTATLIHHGASAHARSMRSAWERTSDSDRVHAQWKELWAKAARSHLSKLVSKFRAGESDGYDGDCDDDLDETLGLVVCTSGVDNEVVQKALDALGKDMFLTCIYDAVRQECALAVRERSAPQIGWFRSLISAGTAVAQTNLWLGKCCYDCCDESALELLAECDVGASDLLDAVELLIHHGDHAFEEAIVCAFKRVLDTSVQDARWKNLWKEAATETLLRSLEGTVSCIESALEMAATIGLQVPNVGKAEQVLAEKKHADQERLRVQRELTTTISIQLTKDSRTPVSSVSLCLGDAVASLKKLAHEKLGIAQQGDARYALEDKTLKLYYAGKALKDEDSLKDAGLVDGASVSVKIDSRPLKALIACNGVVELYAANADPRACELTIRVSNKSYAQVGALSFSADGSMILAEVDGAAHAFSVDSGELKHTFGNPEKNSIVTFSPSGGKVIVVEAEYLFSAKLFDTATGLMLKDFHLYDDTLYSLQFVPQAEKLLKVTGFCAEFVDLATGKQGNSFSMQGRSVFRPEFDRYSDARSALFSPTGRHFLLMSDGYHAEAKLFDSMGVGDPFVAPLPFARLGPFESIDGKPSISFSPDGSSILAASRDDGVLTAKLFDIASGDLVRRFEGLSCASFYNAFAVFSPNGKILTALEEGVVSIHDLASGSKLTINGISQCSSPSVKFSPMGDYVLLMCTRNEPPRKTVCRLHCTSTGKLVREFEDKDAFRLRVAFGFVSSVDRD